jgi:hypothetical protein
MWLLEIILQNSFFGWIVFSSVIALTVPAVAQNSNTGMPREPTTKAGKCAKANGGNWVPNRGWYTRDRLGYQKCMRS